MIIHVVQNGETINSIANKYGVAVDRLIIENGIEYPGRLVVGETIVILYPEVTYTIKEGDTLGGIAEEFDVSIFQILRNNPYLSDREYIYPGETIVISYEGNKTETIAINAFAYPFIDRNILKKTLPFLTYLTVYSYEITAEGNINDIDDTEIIQMAKSYGVAPVMMLIASSQSMEEEISVIHSILLSEEKQENFFNNLLRILQTKGYFGVSINTPYILPADRNLYEELVIELSSRLLEAGFKLYNTFSIRIFQLLTGTIFLGVDYARIGQEVDGITLISYVFGYSEGIPPGTTSMDTFKQFIESSTRVVTSKKINIGVPVIGYVWLFPYIPGMSKGMAVSYDTAIRIAFDNNAEIQFDDTTNAAYFQYISEDEYIVRFWDARSIDSYVKLVPQFDLNGISIWNIMYWFPSHGLSLIHSMKFEKYYNGKSC